MQKMPRIEQQRFMQFYKALVETLAKHQLEEEDWTTKKGMERDVKRAFSVDQQDVEQFARCLVGEECSQHPLICLFNGWYRLAIIDDEGLILWVNGSEHQAVRAGRKTITDLSREFPEIPLKLDCLH